MCPEFPKNKKFWTLKFIVSDSFDENNNHSVMKHFLIAFLILISFNSISQNKNDWYILGETGFNQVNGKNKIHFGFGAEYFISGSKSFIFRLKYFKNGINYFKKSNPCSSFFCLFSSSSKKFLYEASVLKIPINYKWEKAMFSSNLNFFFNTGFALNFFLDENYIEVINITPDLNKVSLDFNFGLGFLYKVNSNLSVFTSTEIFTGSPKSEEKIGFIFSSKLRTEQSLLNFGIRYKLK